MRTHVSLAVRDVPQSVAFYARVFGVAPQKQTGRYAKFDLAEPALNFSLVEGEPSRVSHLGIEAQSAEEFARLHERLTEAGVPLRTESQTRCCYALQDKLWFADPDGNAWEVFQVHEQLPVTEGAGDGPCGIPAEAVGPPGAAQGSPRRSACCG